MMIGWWFVQGLNYPVRYYLGILGSYHNPWKRNPYQQTGIYLNHGCSNLLQVNDSKGVEGKFGECTSLLNWPPLVSGAFFLHPQVAVCRMRFAPSSMVASWGWYEFSIQQKTPPPSPEMLPVAKMTFRRAILYAEGMVWYGLIWCRVSLPSGKLT